MNILKLKKIILAVLFIQPWSSSALKCMAINAPVEVYFLPKNIDEFYNRLMTLLDNAKNHVFVAMYWLTDDRIIHKLISLKQGGVDVQIIFDASVNQQKNVNDFVQKLLEIKIIPYVLPVLPNIQRRKMHNKFVVIDGKIVLTGSANFTYKVFNKNTRSLNNENIVIFNSNEVAEKYGQEFLNLQGEIAKLYIDIIARQELGQIAHWMREISSALYAQDSRFVKLLERKFSEYRKDQQRRLTEYFNLQPKPVIVAPEFSSEEAPWEESDVIISPLQPAPAIQPQPVLVAPEFSSEEAPWEESDVIISPLQPAPAIQPQPGALELESSYDESWEKPMPPFYGSKPQLGYLQSESSSDEPWQEYHRRPSDYMESESSSDELVLEKPPAPFTQHPKWDPVTPSQQYFLKKQGYNYSDISQISKQQAFKIISEIKRNESQPDYK